MATTNDSTPTATNSVAKDRATVVKFFREPGTPVQSILREIQTLDEDEVREMAAAIRSLDA